ncbi:MAG: 3-deoxy-manno-octulosonate cytidylyltransferase [Paracoccaceae bacterium]|nr:3-deoxy-manno-octulosonate cytidylyltransferase [Paracoccaceae bacterium]MDG2258382.1 3-deoxy-manno-octulosonate cytidylyltransferase [Paracoccaceae bacterium]
MKSIAIIPARMGSSRFPGKPLAKISGIPMIGHCYFRTQMCDELYKTYVATCDQEIADYVTSIGGNVIMTSDKHERASDRTAEAMLKAEEEIGEKVDIVVMVQGDEPMVTPGMISQSLQPFSGEEDINVVNLMATMKTVEEFEDPNEVKVVVDRNNNALYFSREPIPSRRKGVTSGPMLKQVCIIPFKRDYLLHFNELAETELEIVESVDMMRCLENGEGVKMIMTDVDSFSVDTPEDLANVQKHMLSDSLMAEYS